MLLAWASESKIDSGAAGSKTQREREETENLQVNCCKDF